jgi:hypothetical protein
LGAFAALGQLKVYAGWRRIPSSAASLDSRTRAVRISRLDRQI